MKDFQLRFIVFMIFPEASQEGIKQKLELFDLPIYQGTLYIKTSKGYTSESTYGIAEKNDLSHSDKITSR